MVDLRVKELDQQGGKLLAKDHFDQYCSHFCIVLRQYVGHVSVKEVGQQGQHACCTDWPRTDAPPCGRYIG